MQEVRRQEAAQAGQRRPVSPISPVEPPQPQHPPRQDSYRSTTSPGNNTLHTPPMRHSPSDSTSTLIPSPRQNPDTSTAPPRQNTIPRKRVPTFAESPHNNNRPPPLKSKATIQTVQTKRSRSFLEPFHVAHHKRPWNRFPWLLEIGSLALSIGAMAASITLMAWQDGKPLAEWDFFFGLNTVVAALGVVSKSTLAFAVGGCLGQHKWNWFRRHRDRLSTFEKFDEASRGPWGSMLLLFKTNPRNWAVLGALVTLGSLVMDPFLQETVGNEEVAIWTNHATAQPVTLPVAGDMDLGTLVNLASSGALENFPREFGIMPRVDSFKVRPELGLLGAINDGFHRSAPNTTTGDPVVSFQCPTGNCTYPVWASMGVCSKCVDVSELIEKERFEECGKNGTDQTLLPNVDITAPCTKYSVAPYGSMTQFDGKHGMGQEAFVPKETKFHVFLTARTEKNFDETVAFQDMDTMFYSYLIMRAADDFVTDQVKWEDSTPTATECGLYLCTNAYRSRVSGGKLHEDKVGSWAQRDPTSWRPFEYYSHENVSNWADNTPSLGSDELFRSPLRLTIPEDKAKELEIPGSQMQANVSQATIYTLQQYLTALTFERVEDVLTSSHRDVLVYPLDPESAASSPIAETLWYHRDPSRIFAALADRLSVHFREASLRVEGRFQDMVTVHQIEWWFLALPLASLVLGTVYCVAVFFHTRAVGLPVWKDGIYPALTYGFSEETQALLKSADGDSANRDLVEEVRNGMRIALAQGADGYRLQVTQR